MPTLPIFAVSSRAARCQRWAFIVAVEGTLLTLACGQSPANEGRFWNVTDSSAPVSTQGSGGSGGQAGSGGQPGTSGSGGRPGGAGTGGAGTGGAGTGGAGTGTGGTGSGGAGSSATGGAGTSTGALPGSLTVSVTTKTAGGRYQPDNVGAIWISDSSDKFVKSLHVWGSLRRLDLTHWLFATSLTSNTTDAITAATYRTHGTRMATWNGTDVSKATVPDGPYKVCFELADGASAYQCVDFTKGRTHQSVSPPDNSSFTQRTIEYTP